MHIDNQWEWSAEEIRRIGYRVTDVIAEHLTGLPDAPVFRPFPQELAQRYLQSPLPESGARWEEILETFANEIAPFPFGNGHPRFYGWVNSPPAICPSRSELAISNQRFRYAKRISTIDKGFWTVLRPPSNAIAISTLTPPLRIRCWTRKLFCATCARWVCSLPFPMERLSAPSLAAHMEPKGILRGLAVLPGWHGIGVGQALLDAAEDALRGNGCAAATLDTTEPLARAIRFYLRNGYSPSGRISDFFGMRLHQYSKSLANSSARIA